MKAVDIYKIFVVMAIQGRMAEADKLAKQYRDVIHGVADLLSAKYLKKGMELYRGVLFQKKDLKKNRIKVQHPFEFLSFTEDFDVACWFADPVSFISQFVSRIKPDVEGYIQIYHVNDVKEVLFHHSYAKPLNLQETANRISARLGTDPRLFAHYIKTQSEVLIKPENYTMHVFPKDNYCFKSTKELDKKLTPPFETPGWEFNPSQPLNTEQFIIQLYKHGTLPSQISKKLKMKVQDVMHVIDSRLPWHEILTDFNSGLSLRSLAKKYGLSRDQIKRWTTGIEKPKILKRKIRKEESDLFKIGVAYLEGKTIPELAKQKRVTAKNIYKQLSALGILRKTDWRVGHPRTDYDSRMDNLLIDFENGMSFDDLKAKYHMKSNASVSTQAYIARARRRLKNYKVKKNPQNIVEPLIDKALFELEKVEPKAKKLKVDVKDFGKHVRVKLTTPEGKNKVAVVDSEMGQEEVSQKIQDAYFTLYPLKVSGALIHLHKIADVQSGEKMNVFVEEHKVSGLLTVSVSGTPGKWYLGTLIGNGWPKKRNFIYIDAGQGWKWLNYGEVMADIREELERLGVDWQNDLVRFKKKFGPQYISNKNPELRYPEDIEEADMRKIVKNICKSKNYSSLKDFEKEDWQLADALWKDYIREKYGTKGKPL